MWIEKLGAYFLDVSKYILTGVVIASMFKDLDNKIFVYIVGLLLSILCLIVGLILTNKKDRDKEDKDNSTNNN
mgnify:CR=1 FL=1